MRQPLLGIRKIKRREAEMNDIAVIGGGAAGLTAAIAAARCGAAVKIYERGKRIGKKILATGNGRCNFTNANAARDDYHGGNTDFMDSAMKRFWVSETVDFFGGLGVLARFEEDGKAYPYSGTASSVLDVLRRETDRLGVVTVCGFDVKRVRAVKRGFEIEAYDGGRERAGRVIIACGGKASPDLGSNGSGYELLKSFGHRITPLFPSIVQIRTEPETVRKLKGIKINARVSAGSYSVLGELLFTDYGISGPPAFSLSSRIDGADRLYIDMMPEYSRSEVYEMISARVKRLGYVPLEDLFTGMINKRIGQALLKYAGIAPLSRKSETLTAAELERVTDAVKGLCLKIKGTMSWNNAQVTKGGAVTDDFDPETMESKLAKGLYACGEVLDIDGDCGGYNLQWAWSSGYIAGMSAAGK